MSPPLGPKRIPSSRPMADASLTELYAHDHRADHRDGRQLSSKLARPKERSGPAVANTSVLHNCHCEGVQDLIMWLRGKSQSYPLQHFALRVCFLVAGELIARATRVRLWNVGLDR
jgi:hypothetical protein